MKVELRMLKLGEHFNMCLYLRTKACVLTRALAGGKRLGIVVHKSIFAAKDFKKFSAFKHFMA